MKLAISYVKDHGDLDDERIVLKALQDIEIGGYILADTTYISEREVSNKLRHTYWLPDKSIEKGDLVVVYTKTGEDSTKSNKSGRKTHFFYWGLGRTVWNKEEDAATLFLVGDWSSKKV